MRREAPVVDAPRGAPLAPCGVLERMGEHARAFCAAVVQFRPLGAVAAAQHVAYDAVTPLPLGMLHKRVDPRDGLRDPFGVCGGDGDEAEAVVAQSPLEPRRRVDVEKHEELRLRARVDEVLKLAVDRLPVVDVLRLPDDGVFAVRLADGVHGVPDGEAAQLDAAVGEAPRRLKLLHERAVAAVLRMQEPRGKCKSKDASYSHLSLLSAPRSALRLL